MPKREDEFWAGKKEGKGLGLCPFCGSSNIYYNKPYESWRCGKCEKSFPSPSYGPGEDFGKEARWFGKTTEKIEQKEFAEVAREARAKERRKSRVGSNTLRLPRAIKKWIPRRAWRGIPLGIRKLFINLLVITGLGLAAWTGYLLFTHQTAPVRGTIIFLVAVGFLIWIISLLHSRRYRYAKPSFKLVFSSLLGITLVCAFAGIEPLATYKDISIDFVTTQVAKVSGFFNETATSGTSTAVPHNVGEGEQVPEESHWGQQTIQELENETFVLINMERERAGVPPTKWDDYLYRLSKAHTEEMADRGELFHTPMGATYGENAWGALWGGISRQNLARTIVDGWMSSPLHRAWLLHAPLKTSVVSIVDDNRGQYASWTFWTGEAGTGPPLVKKAYDIWISETGGNIPWLDWLYNIKGYPDNTGWLLR